MNLDPFELVPLGRTKLTVTRLGLGAASLGGLYRAVSDTDAVEVVEHAWEMGIRSFDTAPLYGYGHGERRMGLGLQEKPRDAFVLSTKVGRLLVPRDQVAADADIDRQLLGTREDAYYPDTPPVRVVFDYSFDGVMRSVQESLERLGLSRVDILYVHDPDDHFEAVVRGAWPALQRLRAEGTVGAIGVGIKQVEWLVRFARIADPDVFMVAGRYTLLDPSALDELMPLCAQKGIAVVIAGVMNSGILADPRPGATFDYGPAAAAWLERAAQLRACCQDFDVPLKAAAVQFAMAHPQVASLIAGVRTRDHLDEYPALMETPIPADLWTELRRRRLIPDAAPTPI